MTCGAEACKLGAMIQGVELRVHFLKSFQKGSTCENLLQKGLKSEKVGPTDKQILTPFLEVSCSTCWSFFTWPHQEFKKHMNSRYTFFFKNCTIPVRLAYQPLADITFLSEQTSHQQPGDNNFL
jgi:hypothetical protein